MVKDKRYGKAKNLIGGGYIKTLDDLVDTVPKTIIAKDLKMHHQTFQKYLDDPGYFDLNTLYEIAVLLEIDLKVMVNIALGEELPIQRSKKRK